MRKLANLAILALTTLACSSVAACVTQDDGPDPEQGGFEGTEGDSVEHATDDGKADRLGYDLATAIAENPALPNPEIVVSLKGLTAHLFDRTTGFSEVYPIGPGVLGRSGRSITPTGHFKTQPDTSRSWDYMPARWDPAYFDGLPFLRLNIRSSSGANTYAFHGPITGTLHRGYVSHGCVRMQPEDIIRLFYSVKAHPSTYVSIQQEVETDANGVNVDVGMTPALYAADATIPFGASIGPRPWN